MAAAGPDGQHDRQHDEHRLPQPHHDEQREEHGRQIEDCRHGQQQQRHEHDPFEGQRRPRRAAGEQAPMATGPPQHEDLPEDAAHDEAEQRQRGGDPLVAVRHRPTFHRTSIGAWLRSSSITEGPILRPIDRHGLMADTRLSDRAVAEVVKRTAAAAGLDPVIYSGHSLRAGFITAAAEAGVQERHIMAHSRHQSIPVMRRYIRGAGLFRDNAAAAVGL